MLNNRKINQIAKQVATANLSSQNFTTVTTGSTTDSTGNEALQITIVIKPGAETKITGDAALKTLVQMQDKLRKAGEDRFPIIEYATTKELAESGDS
jgi:outer membrane protein assembly factor BamA